MARDKLEVVEAAYRLSGSDHDWLVNVAEAVARSLDDAVSAHAFVVHGDDAGRPKLEQAYVRGVEGARAYLEEALGTMSRADATLFFGRGLIVGTYSERVDDTSAPSHGPIFAAARDRGGEDLYGLSSGDAFGNATVVGAILRSRRSSRPAEQAAWEMVAVHADIARRLRELSIRDLLHEASAVLSPDGEVKDATGDAAGSRETREKLSAAARAVERARLRRSPLDEVESLALWRGLVDGRWSIVDQQDSDGRRFYVAVENPPPAVALRRLTARERQVAASALTGAPHKITGYALGIGEAAVAKHLGQAMRKLGVGDRIALMRLAVGLGAVPEPPE